MTSAATGGAATVYLIDTSALVDVPALPSPADAWNVIRRLIADGRMFICREAWTELERVDPDVFDSLRDVRAEFVMRSTSATHMLEVGRIQYTYPRMSRALKPGERADAYIVAHAKINGYCVVTNEDNRRQKMPVACGREGVECINLAELLAREGGLLVPLARRAAPR